MGLDVSQDSDNTTKVHLPGLRNVLFSSTSQADHSLQLEDGSRVVAQLPFPLNQNRRPSLATDFRLGFQSRCCSLFCQVSNGMKGGYQRINV